MDEDLKTKKKEYGDEFIGRSQGYLGIHHGEHEFLVNKKELKNWRIAYATSFILWFFLGGEIIGDNIWVVFYLISFIIPHIIMYHIAYKNYYFERIYGVKWSKEAEEHRLGKK